MGLLRWVVRRVQCRRKPAGQQEHWQGEWQLFAQLAGRRQRQMPRGALLLPAGARGPAFLVYDNFAAIEAYNKADSYVIAVGHLADRIAGGAAFKAAWPRDLRALTLDERREMQSLLLRAGVYAGTPDGKVGPLTIAAVKAFQRKHGMVPDGYPSLEILQALR